MSDSKPTGSEPDAANLSKSFADRLTFPGDKDANTTPAKKFNWSDEFDSPATEKPAENFETATKKTESTEEPAKKPEASKTSVEAAQMDGAGQQDTDGATEWLKGSSLDEPEFDVNVKLADLQEDPNNPLYSVKNFADLNL